MAKRKVFISFDFDIDKVVKEFTIGQSKRGDAPFDVVDNSLKESAPEKDWLDKPRMAISRSEVFIIMLGPKTRNSSGVLKETQFQVFKYNDDPASWAVPDDRSTYNWDRDRLTTLFI